jgi:hypothetical protein
MGLNAAYRESCICCEIYATKAAGSPAANTLLNGQASPDQALALFSTARSERSA